jgi:hypothetical protein
MIRRHIILTAWIIATILELALSRPWSALVRKFPILNYL